MMNRDTAPGMVGKYVTLWTENGMTYGGAVSTVSYDETEGLWLELDGQIWVSVRHVVAADWRQPDE
jgi:hypothetical protein